MRNEIKTGLLAVLLAAVPPTAYISNRVSTSGENLVPAPQQLTVYSDCRDRCYMSYCTTYARAKDGRSYKMRFSRTYTNSGCIVDI